MEEQTDRLPLLTHAKPLNSCTFPINTIRDMIQRKKLLAFKVGNQWRIRRREITKLIPQRPA